MKIVPKKIKIKNTIWKNYSFIEMIIALIVFIIVFLLFTNNNKIIAIILGSIFIISYIPIGDDLFYSCILEMIIYIIKPKKYTKNNKNNKKNINKIIPIKNINDDGIIIYNNNTYAKVVKIGQKNFFLEDSEQQDLDIESIAKAFNCIDIQTTIDIVKIYQPLDFNEYINDLDKKIQKENNKSKIDILKARNKYMNELQKEINDYYPNYYIVIYNNKLEEIELITDMIVTEIIKSGVNAKFLNKKETAIFLKYNYNNYVNEKEITNIEDDKLIDWIIPNEITFYSNKYIINNQEASIIAISDYPLKVKNGWADELFNIPNTKINMRIQLIEKSNAIKKIDNCILELETKEALSTSTSETKDAKVHMETMVELLQKLQSENESLFDVSIYTTCYKLNDINYKKIVKNKIRNLNFKSNLLNYVQKEAFISSDVNNINKINKYNRSLNTMTLASFFPFCKNYIMDEDGIYLGKIKYNNHPFIFNIWKRGDLYQNSNAFVIGKSGSGKTYFLKNLLINEWSNNTRIIICDPEAEYLSITKKLNGNIIDVGNAKEGRLNPFQIYQILTEDGNNANSITTFHTHLKTLESFFKLVLPGVSNDIIEIVNSLVIETYKEKGIDEYTNCINFTADKYPIFSDLINILNQKIENETDSFILEKYSLAKIHLNKFVIGRYSDIWNHPSTLKTNASVITFNFQSLFANKNNVVANAQMLLVFRFIEQEIINSREKNRNGDNIKTLIIVDEAHLFIDPNYPIALDFFYQMNKRIRKYDGAFIPSTQNISDWNSNEQLRHKTSTIIKNSQYTFIFKLSSPDMQDVIDIYKAGNSFNKEERKTIISATTGQAFFIGSSELRESIKIVTNDEIKQIID